jgi:ABC-type sugar transport system permease subunit
MVAIELALGLLLALAMLRPFRGRRVLMTLYVVPLFMSPVVVGGFFDLFVRRPYGVANQLTSWVWPGDVTVDFSQDSPWVYIVLVLADVWQWTPFMFVILLAGLASIPDTLYEAADLDGAKPRQSFLFVTLPLLLPIILIAVTFRLIDAVKLFDIIFTLTRGGPGTDTYTTSYYLYQQGFEFFHLGQRHGRRLDVPDHAHLHLVLARAEAAQARSRRPDGRRGRRRAQSERHGSSRVVRGSASALAAFCGSPSSPPTRAFSSCRCTGWPSRRSKGRRTGSPIHLSVSSSPTSINYSDALNNFNGWKGLENSIVVAVVTTILAVALGTAAAYSMARFRTGGKHLAFWFLSGRMLPPIAIVIPVFLLYSRYSEEWFGFTLIDTRAGLILLYTVFALPFTVWMMYAYFRQMPPELEEAALVDGCSRLQALRKIAWPLAALRGSCPRLRSRSSSRGPVPLRAGARP